MAGFVRRVLLAAVVGSLLVTFILSWRRPDLLDGVLYDTGTGGLEPEWQWARDVSIVFPWVNASDPVYISEKVAALGQVLAGQADQARSHTRLPYALRALEKYLPWHRGTVYILTPDQTPAWLDTSHPRVRVVSQAEILPSGSYPSWNDHLVMWYLDRVPGITEHFIFMEPDSLALSYTHPSTFFTPSKEARFYQQKQSADPIALAERQYTLTSIQEAYNGPAVSLIQPINAPLAIRRSFFSAPRLFLSKHLVPMHSQKSPSERSLLPIPSIVDYAHRLSRLHGEESVATLTPYSDEPSEMPFLSAVLTDDLEGNAKLFRALRARSASRFRFASVKDGRTQRFVGMDAQWREFLEARWPTPSPFETMIPDEKDW